MDPNLQRGLHLKKTFPKFNVGNGSRHTYIFIQNPSQLQCVKLKHDLLLTTSPKLRHAAKRVVRKSAWNTWDSKSESALRISVIAKRSMHPCESFRTSFFSWKSTIFILKNYLTGCPGLTTTRMVSLKFQYNLWQSWGFLQALISCKHKYPTLCSHRNGRKWKGLGNASISFYYSPGSGLSAAWLSAI